jgi:HEAT repeat protein
MLERKQLKAQGLRYARTLQTVVKTVNMFSADHKSVDGLLQRSYEQLNPLLKQVRLLTLGFVDQRFLLNNILTSEASLKPLENDLLKRGIGAVSFEAGLTFAAYKKAIAALAANPRSIEECGGLMPFLEQRELEFVRIFPAVKNEVRNEDGDTVLEMGSEEYLISKALSNLNSGFANGVESMLTHMAAGAGESAFGVVNYGGTAGGQGGSAAGSFVAGPASAGAGTGTGDGTGSGGTSSGAPSFGTSAEPNVRSGFQGSFMEIQKAVERKFDASMSNPEEDPEKAYVELGKMLGNVRSDLVLSQLMGNQGGGKGASKEEVTAELFEDTAIRWALRRLSVVPAGEEAVIVEEQVFRVLLRSLQATHTATRLAQKLAEFAKEYALPKHTLERIQEEIRWLSLTTQQRLRELLAINHFSAADFRRTLDLLRELTRQGKNEDAVALGMQYFSLFEDHLTIRMEEIGRIPELLRALSGIPGEFWQAAAEWLKEALTSAKLNQLMHVQVVNALVALARIAGTYEDFELVRGIGAALEESAARDAAHHALCCTASTANLVQASAVDRIAEIFLQKRNDAQWIRVAASLLQWAAPEALERLFIRLDAETTAANRLALLRLISRLGKPAMRAARQRLSHSEWYVVRNACKLLGELKDPELLQHIVPALTHTDERVQKAALHAIMDTRLPGSATVLAENLERIAPVLFDEVLGELIFQADGRCLPQLEKCFASPVLRQRNVLTRLIPLIAAIRDVPAADLLARLSRDQSLDAALRQAALDGLSVRQKKNLQRWLAETDGDDTTSLTLRPRFAGA